MKNLSTSLLERNKAADSVLDVKSVTRPSLRRAESHTLNLKPIVDRGQPLC
jgi:hypothetical protein